MKIYKYVVTKTGRYKLLCQSDTESIVPVITYSETYNGTENSIVNNNEFLFTTIGKTYYFRVKNTDAENKAMVTLALNEVVAEEITAAGTTVTLKPGETKWYVYNIPESDMYIFDVRNLYSEYKSVSIYKNITDLSGVGNNINLGSMYEKSSNVYLKIDNTQSTDVTINLSVLRWPDEELQLGVTKVIDLKQNNPSVMRFRFTVKEDGYYYFQESSTEKWVSFFNFHVDGKVQQVQPLTPYLRKGQCVYVIAYLNYGTTNPEAYAMFRIDKIQEYTLEEGEELTVSVKPWGLETYINFTTKKAAHYAIGFKDIPEGITVETNYTWYGMEDYYVDYNEDVGDTHCIRVSAVANTSEEITFMVYAEEIKKEVLTEDGAELNVPRYKKAWYTFTAPEDGLYNFTADSVNEEIKYWIFEDIDAYYPSLEGTMPCKEYRLKKNETIGIVVYYLNNKADKSGEKVADNASFKLNVSRTEIKEMPVSGTTAELAANEYSWYSYTAAKTGEYNFSSTNGSITLYQHITDNTALSPNLMLEEGKKIYIKVSNNTSENQSIAVNVKVFEAQAFTMENPAQISFTEAEISNGITYKWLSFTPARAGYYKFTNEAVTGIVNTYYGTSNGSISNEYFVGAGKTVYIKVSANAAASSKISAAKGNTQFDYQILEFNKAKKVTLETDEIEYYEFTAPKNGEYRFYSIDVEATGGGWIEGYLYDDQMNPLEAGSYAGENSNFLLRRKLSEGETVYLKLEQDSYYSSISIEYEIYASLWD